MKQTPLRRYTPLRRGPGPKRKRSERPRPKADYQLRKWADQVKVNANGQCERCPLPGVHSHHVLTRGAHPEAKYDARNGVCLCLMCHIFAHMKPVEFRGWFKSLRPYDDLYLRGRYPHVVKALVPDTSEDDAVGDEQSTVGTKCAISNI